MTALDQLETEFEPSVEGMAYAEFFERFGASYRTKNVDLAPGRRTATRLASGRPLERLKRRSRHVAERIRQAPADSARQFGSRQVRTVTRAGRPPAATRRPFRLPTRSELPAEFIRLCPWEGEYLFMLAAGARRGIVETGRLRGGSTFLMTCANQTVPITSIDIAPMDDAGLTRHLARAELGANVDLIVGDSQHTDYEQAGAIDLLFVDGDHSYEGCLADLRNWFGKLVQGGHVVVHDSYFSGSVRPAVIDFLREQDADVIRTPHIPASYWHQPAGSLAHFVKR